ncbi:MAG: DUF4346 domain-containing protein [Deltaproteobacteria bacterium]|jgi:thymidylate synthase|nr:DUF4346 domain-containing protein [Deltaproteobacteria bacterium]
MLDFQWAVESNKVKIVNPFGTVAVCCLWTPLTYLEKLWQDRAPSLLAPNSHLGALGGLYGGGLKIMLRNLHHNPQIDTVILLGKDFSGVVEHLVNFFQGQIIKTGQKQYYVFEDGRQVELEKLIIPGAETSHSLDELIQPDMFKWPPKILDWSKEPDNSNPQKLTDFLANYKPRQTKDLERPERVPLPRPVTTTFPSELAGHVIVSDTILEGWDELLFRLARFGPLIQLRNGKIRNELLNIKVVIRNPGQYTSEDLAKRNLTESRIKAYQADLLKSGLDDGAGYSYGHRLGSYFGRDLLKAVAEDLAINLDSRHSYLTLWDNNKDLSSHDSPCLVSLFFRKIQNQVHLTATFRSHNGARAWPINCFGLWGILVNVCQNANQSPQKTETFELSPGQLTVFSQSISLDPSELTAVADQLKDYQHRPHILRKDPHGYFKLALDPAQKKILVWQFNHDDDLIAIYQGQTPTELARELQRNLAISDLGHALYLGGQLERAYYCLEKGLEYVQDRTKLP